MGDVIVTSGVKEPTIRTCRCAIRVVDISGRVDNLTLDSLVDDNSAHQEPLTPRLRYSMKLTRLPPPRLVLPRRSGKTPNFRCGVGSAPRKTA
jgi:hypothetical protein